MMPLSGLVQQKKTPHFPKKMSVILCVFFQQTGTDPQSAVRTTKVSDLPAWTGTKFFYISASQRYKNQYTRIVTWFEIGVNFFPVSIASQIRSILECLYDVSYFAS